MIDARWIITSVYKNLYLSGLRATNTASLLPTIEINTMVFYRYFLPSHS